METVIDYGILSLIPPVLAIILAVWTKNILVSLFVPVFIGATILNGWNPVLAFPSMIKDYMFVALDDSMYSQTLIMIAVIGGFVALLTRTGGAQAFTHYVTRFVDSRRKCETGMWLGGLFVWFTDNGNSLIVGPIFEALGEKMRVSREKFSYILDCTTVPICCLIPFIGWGVYTMGLVEAELTAAHVTDVTAWDAFMEGIPYNFYAILTLFMAGFVSFTSWDYGPMLKAENRAMKTGATIRQGGVPMRNEEKKIELPEGVTPKLYTVLVPLAVLLVVIFTYLTIKGLWWTKVPGTDIRTSIACGFLCSTLVLIAIAIKEKIYTFSQCLDVIVDGMKNMMFMYVVLVLAWSLSGVTKAIGTAEFITEICMNFLNPAILPFLVFLICAVMSMATGTSWGSMAIVMPLALPLAIAFEPSQTMIAVVSTAVVAGSIFGDHCSPISDTTLMASIGAASDHIDHFKTQMPYGFTVAVVSGIMYLCVGKASPFVILIAGAILLAVLIYALHKVSVKKYGFEKDTMKELLKQEA